MFRIPAMLVGLGAATLTACGGRASSAASGAPGNAGDGGSSPAPASAVGGRAAGGSRTAEAGSTGDRGGAAGEGGAVSATTGGSPSAAGAGGAGGGPGAMSCDGEYVACGCGCCGPEPLGPTHCYYPAAGESRDSVRLADDAAKANSNCAILGCHAGFRYVCCLSPAPDPADAATYSLDYWAGGLDHLRIDRVGQDGQCTSLALAGPSNTQLEGWALQVPASWGVVTASHGPCDPSSSVGVAIGAEGSLVLRAAGDRCVVDTHLALFFELDDGTIEAVRLDADALEVEAMNVLGCS